MEIRQDHVNVAVLSAIGALAKKLTGESLSVKVTDGNGDFAWVDTSLGETMWSKPLAEPGVVRGSRPEQSGTHLEQPAAQRDTTPALAR